MKKLFVTKNVAEIKQEKKGKKVMFKTGAVIKGFVASKWGKMVILGTVTFVGAKSMLNGEFNEQASDITDTLVFEEVQEAVVTDGAATTTVTKKTLASAQGKVGHQQIKVVEAKEEEKAIQADGSEETAPSTQSVESDESTESTESVESVQAAESTENVASVQHVTVQPNTDNGSNAAEQARIKAEAEAQRIAAQAQAAAEQAARDAQAEADRQAAIAAEEAERQRQQAEEAARLQPGSVYVNGVQVNGYEQSSNVFTGFNNNIVGSTVTITDSNGSGRNVYVNPTPVYAYNMNGSYVNIDTLSNVDGLVAGSYGTVFMTTGTHPTEGLTCVIIYTAY